MVSTQPEAHCRIYSLLRQSVLCVSVCLVVFRFCSKATGMDAPDTGRLSHIYQLSGFADPVYAEACVTVHDYDIVLEVCRCSCPMYLTLLSVVVCVPVRVYGFIRYWWWWWWRWRRFVYLVVHGMVYAVIWSVSYISHLLALIQSHSRLILSCGIYFLISFTILFLWIKCTDCTPYNI